MPNWKIYSFATIFLWKSSRLIHMIVSELLRMLDGLANRSFCRSDISRVQLMSNWTVGLKLVASDREVVGEEKLNLHKRKWTFLQCLISKITDLEKIFSDWILSLYTGYSENSLHYQMALWTNHFDNWTCWGSSWSPTEQLVLTSDQ